jgi:hypothetical protein
MYITEINSSVDEFNRSYMAHTITSLTVEYTLFPRDFETSKTEENKFDLKNSKNRICFLTVVKLK